MVSPKDGQKDDIVMRRQEANKEPKGINEKIRNQRTTYMSPVTVKRSEVCTPFRTFRFLQTRVCWQRGAKGYHHKGPGRERA